MVFEQTPEERDPDMGVSGRRSFLDGRTSAKEKRLECACVFKEETSVAGAVHERRMAEDEVRKVGSEIGGGVQGDAIV